MFEIKRNVSNNCAKRTAVLEASSTNLPLLRRHPVEEDANDDRLKTPFECYLGRRVR